MVLVLLIAMLAAAVGAFCLASHMIALGNQNKLRARSRERMGGPCSERASPVAQLRAIVARLPVVGPRLRRAQRLRLQQACCSELPRMLEVLALGLQVGMGFDQAFGLYLERYQTTFSQTCARHYQVWNKGLVSREDGMRAMAAEVDVTIFSRFVQAVLRSLRYGAPMAQMALDLASEARKDYRSKQQEAVAKAPVKMLVPTGMLILPAMMLLVLGPIVLQLMERMH
jgi:tight adherence protein C